MRIKAFRNVNIETLNKVAVLGVMCLALLCLFMANNVALASYQKNMLQKNINDIRTEIRDLNLKLSEKRSIGFLKQAVQNLGLIVNDQIQYIKVVGPVAKNQ
ncbi:hypothetical protein KKH14_01455 [Patescibacteria group bacterium]|nr:hypothetical protein [Patescibacteria group bacterium]